MADIGAGLLPSSQQPMSPKELYWEITQLKARFVRYVTNCWPKNTWSLTAIKVKLHPPPPGSVTEGDRLSIPQMMEIIHILSREIS